MTIHARASAITNLLAIVLAACGPTEAATRWQASVDTVGDTVIVRTLAGSVWPSEATLVTEVEIGELEGDDAYMFGNVQALAVSAEGDVYALDGQVPALRKYAATGEHLANFYRKGGGPGEYNRPDGGLAVLADGRVLLRDPGNARVNVYSNDGQSIGHWTLPSGGGWNTSRKLYTDRAGNSYTMVLLERNVPVPQWRYGLARFAPDGTHTDTLPAPTWSYETPQVSAQKENSSSASTVPFSPSPSWTFSPLGYLVGGLSTAYRIDLYRTSEPVLRIERSWQPVPVSAAEKADAEERITFNFRNNYPGWRWNGPPIPEAKPPFRGINVAEDGRIWVVLSQPGVEILSEREALEQREQNRRMPARFREPVAFDVFEPDGTYLGRVRTPEGFTTSPDPVIRGDHIWAVARDSLDVARIVRYRIQQP